MMEQEIEATKIGRVLVVALNRPASRNAMSARLVDEMLAALATDAEIGALVLTGTGRGFCAGSDLAGLAMMGASEKSAFETASGLLARRIMAHPLPVLAAVHGFAIGGGLTLAAACDIVVTSVEAKWSLPEVPIGLFPAWGLEAVALRVGRPAARRLAWGIDMISGEAAVAMGLADAAAEKPLSPIHSKSNLPLSVAIVENVMNGFAAVAGNRSARKISVPL